MLGETLVLLPHMAHMPHSVIEQRYNKTELGILHLAADILDCSVSDFAEFQDFLASKKYGNVRLTQHHETCAGDISADHFNTSMLAVSSQSTLR